MELFKSKTTKTTKKTNAKDVKPKEEKKVSMKDLYDGGEKTKASAKTDKVMISRGNAYRILLKPLITEKAATQATEGKYFFEVSDRANKIEISDAISDVYGIKPKAINVVSVKGKAVRHGRISGQRKDWKKAIVTLPKGKTINIYEGV